MYKPVYIVKAGGEREAFSDVKLRESLARAGTPHDIIEKIVHHISHEIEDGMTTSHIYQHAFELLHKLERPIAARYSLRRAMIGFGPSGFPFEKFLAELFKKQGFETMTGQIVKGACVEHEIDVVAWNDEKLQMVEAKFHNEVGTKTDLKVALYVKARFDDLINESFFYGKRRSLDQGWLITNTKFSTNATRYGECSNLKMLGWNYPEHGNLQDLIEDAGLHPLTCLTTLTNSEKQYLLGKGVVLCKSVREHGILESAGFKKDTIARVRDEAQLLCDVP